MGARVANSAADAAQGANIIISAVTAASSLEAAKSGRAAFDRQSLFPRHQFGVAGPEEGHGKLLGAKAHYVNIAILAPIYPARHQTPLLHGSARLTVMPL